MSIPSRRTAVVFGLAGFVAVVAAIKPRPASVAARTTTASPDATIGDRSKVMGPDSCSECHTNEHRVWMDSAHELGARSLTRDPKAKRIAEVLGVRRIKTDDRCISCHYTPQLTDRGRVKSVAGVSCESCHGPAQDWINEHSVFGDNASSALEETPQHRAMRLSLCDGAGMRRPDALYELADACYSCHFIHDKELTAVAGHPAGERFEFASWSQGSIRHNFVRSGAESNPLSAAPRQRVMYVLGAALRLEYTCRAVVSGASVTIIEPSLAPLRAIAEKANLQEVSALIALSESVVNGEDAAVAAIRAGEIGRRIASERIGASEMAIDVLIPDPWVELDE